MKVKLNDGTTVGVEMVKVNKINVDPHYQRAIIPAWVDEICANMVEGGLGAIILSQREDGSLWALDGLQRYTAVDYSTTGRGSILSVIHYGLTPEQEAHLFVTLNKRKLVRPPSVYMAELFAGADWAVEIDSVLTKYGITVTQQSAIASLKTALRLGVLDTTLGVLNGAWGEFPRQANRGEYIKGIAMLLANNPDMDVKVLTKVLARSSIGNFHIAVIEQGKKYRFNTGQGVAAVAKDWYQIATGKLLA